MRQLIVCCILLVGCIEPTEPDFQLEDPFYLVEGQIADREGFSELRIRRSNFREVQLTFEEVSDAIVVSEEETTGQQVRWLAEEGEPGRYRPPATFAAAPGEKWSLHADITGEVVAVSLPEDVPGPTRIDTLIVEFAPQGEFNEDLNRFLPVFRLQLDFTDPGQAANFYEWDYRYWEATQVCASCNCGVYRNVKCQPIGFCNGTSTYYDYACEDPNRGCYQEFRNPAFTYSTDEFFNGGEVKNFAIGFIPFTNYGGMLVEAIQYGLSPEAYAYGKVISDLVAGNSGLNATIPAALNGNVRNINPDGLEILGNVRVVSVATHRVYYDRTVSLGIPDPARRRINYEPIVGTFVPPRAPCRGNGKTPVKPEGWPN